MKASRLVFAIVLIACSGAAFAQAMKFPTTPQPFKRPEERTSALYKPEGPGPFPAVVLSHTCAGLQWHVFGWAERFVAAGYVALVLDHLGPRRSRFNCPPNSNSVSVTEYAVDAFEALRFLRSQPYVDGARVAQVGFSYGAMAGLRIASKGFAEKHGQGDRFAAIVALYPWCNEQAGPVRVDHQWNFYDDTETPLLLLLGGADDEASPRSCIEQAQKNAASGLSVEWKVYEGATHSFDITNKAGEPVLFRMGRYAYRGDAAVVAQAWKELSAFLDKRMAK